MFFPRADIHEVITPDLLHQVIKGTFKDHIVSWVEDFIRSVHRTKADADRVMDEIDHWCALLYGLNSLNLDIHYIF